MDAEVEEILHFRCDERGVEVEVVIWEDGYFECDEAGHCSYNDCAVMLDHMRGPLLHHWHLPGGIKPAGMPDVSGWIRSEIEP